MSKKVTFTPLKNNKYYLNYDIALLKTSSDPALARAIISRTR